MSEQTGNENQQQAELSNEQIINKAKELGLNVYTNDELNDLTKSVKNELNSHFSARFNQVDQHLIDAGFEKQDNEKAEDFVKRVLNEKQPKPQTPSTDHTDTIKALEATITELSKENEENAKGYQDQLKEIQLKSLADSITSKLPINEELKTVLPYMNEAFLSKLKQGELTKDGMIFKDEEGMIIRNEKQEPVTAEEIARNHFKDVLKKETPKKKGLEVETTGASITDAVSFASSKPPKTWDDAEILAKQYAEQKGEPMHSGGPNIRQYTREILTHYKIK